MVALMRPENLRWAPHAIQDIIIDRVAPSAAVRQSMKQLYHHKDEGQPAPRCTINCHLFKEDKLIEFDLRDPDRNQDQKVAVTLHCIQKDAVDKNIILAASGTIEF
ncbi:hypothetical protein [Rhizobium rhizogenes]|uniref:hypothetical protein n=1 Tax=Rhizobium rhizogenes TaxID=359 RepID=UPI001571689E|nr:hypothetical protein [Rhizobium rhizogenes]NTF80871.1 hypothetical protein [Rhizobium rhizogenes]